MESQFDISPFFSLLLQWIFFLFICFRGEQQQQQQHLDGTLVFILFYFYGPYGDEVSTTQVATVVMMTNVSNRILRITLTRKLKIQ